MSKLMYIKIGIVVLLLWAGSVCAAENEPLVLFDQGHGQRFLIEETGDLQLSKLADIMRTQHLTVASTKQPLSDEVLKNVSALVISGPFAALRPEEVDAVVRYIERGGRLAAMLHIGPPLLGLLSRLDLDHSNAVLHERQNIIDVDTNFRVTNLSKSPLFSGMTHFSLYGAWALDPGARGTVLAKTSPEAWADLDGNKVLSKGDAVAAFNVVISGNLGTGRFVVFGDDAIFQNRYLDENNSKLAVNLSVWLAGR
ncbi:MAG: DUF4350 domain-containing protein [Desulfuromonadaceae bacterium]|nr:DUF4350 domain-containing protein [Desulfuromonadaceae bacterium]